MRRGVGIQGLKKQISATEKYKVIGADMAEEQLKQMRDQMSVFKNSLEEFARKHKRTISMNPDFRQHFNEMCMKIGVDPLASHKGFWAEILGTGDFYYELAVQIVEVCLRTRSSNGGLLNVLELHEKLTRMRGPKAQQISRDDIERSISKLAHLGNGFRLLNVGSQKMIQSVPCELSVDHTAAMTLAQKSAFVTAEVLVSQLGWTRARVDAVMELLLAEGMAWIDDQSETGERAYWFLSLLKGTADSMDV